MKCNKWTLALAAAGVVSLGSVVQAEEAAQHQVLTALSSTTLSGYVDSSINWRVGNSAKAIPGRSFDGADKQDGFNLNVVSLTLEKPLEEGQWAAGYKAELVFGPDANYYATLLNGGIGGDGNDINIKDAYASFRAPVGNGLDFKLGVFTTVVGYEVFESGNNPNFSRSYGYALEPTHHTGLLASYHVNDTISIAGGIANSWLGPINAQAGGTTRMQGNTEGEKTFLGAVTVTLPEKSGPLAGSAIYIGVVDGKAIGSAHDTTHYYGGLTVATPVEGLSVGGAFDYRNAGTGVGLGTPAGKGWAWAGAGYLSYQATEKLKLNARGDYTRGIDGTYYTAGKGDNELFAATVTADYNLWAGLLTRLEGRWDRDLRGGTAAFGDSHNVFTVALSTVYKF